MIPTFENTIGKIGVKSDGIGTTKMASAGDPTQPLPPELTESIQLGVEDGYRKFITIVAEGRGMNPETVKNVAQGKVWDGTKAVELGLVDQLGELREAVETAAELAGLAVYSPIYIHHHTVPASDLFKKIDWWSKNTFAELWLHVLGGKKIPYSLRDRLEELPLRGDPANMYAHSLIPLSLPYF
jgi:protease-4